MTSVVKANALKEKRDEKLHGIKSAEEDITNIEKS